MNVDPDSALDDGEAREAHCIIGQAVHHDGGFEAATETVHGPGGDYRNSDCPQSEGGQVEKQVGDEA